MTPKHTYPEGSHAARLQAIADALPDTMAEIAEELVEIAWSVYRGECSVNALVAEAQEEEMMRYDGGMQ
jgi:hypothetical protein